MQTNIPDHVFPTELSEKNRINSTYTTNTLIPRLGPLTVIRYLRIIETLVRDYRITSSALKRSRDYHKKHNRWIQLNQPKPEAGDPNLRFRAPFTNTQSLGFALTERLSAFNSARPSVELEQAFFKNKAATATTTLSETAILSHDNQPLSIAGTSVNLVELHRINDMVHLNSGGSATSSSDKNISEEAYDLGNTLHLFAGDNRIVSDLAQIGHIQSQGDMLSSSLKEIAGKPEVNLINVLTKSIKIPASTELKHVNSLVDMAVQKLTAERDINDNFIEQYQREPELRRGLSEYVWDYFRRVDIIGSGIISIPTPDDTNIINSREWAFQRTERLEMCLGKPEFIGPISCESLAPNSTLTTNESTTVTQFSGYTSESSHRRQQTEQHAQSYSQRFQMKLSNMTEEGIQKESEFSKNSTLFSTLKEQRRASIDQVISQISRENEQTQYAGQTSTSHVSREYITEGVDANQSTTELAFQVVSPVHVDVRMQDVGLAWCPRVISPFMNLHRLINDHMDQARQEYLDQNTVLDPIRPLEIYNKKSFNREKHARGRNATQAYNFSYEIEANFKGWELDRSNCKVGFRNGNSGDYNWDERGNWDDLENWQTYFQSLESDGDTISGRAVLSTTDPEYFNRGFLKFNLAVKKLSEESRIALEKYAQERQEAEAQRLATQSRANQYARLRRDELIESYNSQIDLQEEAFRGLIKQIFDNSTPQHHSYYAEVLRSCIDWDKVGIHYESGDSQSLPYPHLPAAHFLNTPAIRLILPVFKSTEEAFFSALEKGAGDYHSSSAEAVNRYITKYRKHIEELFAQDSEQLLLDSYDSELILGRHLEAVLSRTLFEE